MRNIIHGAAHHNARRWAFPFVLMAALALAGCGDGGQQDVSDPCPVTTDDDVWRTFLDLAGRLDEGQAVERDELLAFAEMPVMTQWRRSLAPNSPSPINIANWLDSAFSANNAATTRGKTNPNRRMLTESYNYSFGHRAAIDSLLEDFRAQGACRLDELVEFWIAEENRRDMQIVAAFLPAQSEIRFENDTLLVDTGAFMASGVDQAVEQIASLLYRNHQIIPGENPAILEGGASVAHAFRATVNEGLAGWIARNPETEFRDDHPRLGSIRVVPEKFFQTSRRVLDYGGRIFPAMVADPAVMEARGRAFTNFMTGQNAYGSLGYAMAAVIEARWGEERLREAGRTVPGFLAAYQEAAEGNPVPAPEPGTAGVSLHQTMPPFDPVVFEGLMELLRSTFPE